MPDSKTSDDKTVDLASADSFPASDPPAWIPGVGTVRADFDLPTTKVQDPEPTASLPPYNYKHFSLETYDLTHFQALEIGALVPEMPVMDINGEPFSLRNRLNKRIVIETGSISCPMFMANVEKMNELARQFKDTTFYVLYTREAHPGELIPPHISIDSKLLNARRLQRFLVEQRSILVDNLDGDLHTALGRMPNSVFVFTGRGILKYRASWCDPRQIKTLLSGLTISEREAPADGLLAPKLPPFRKSIPVLFDSGRQAAWDVIKSLPDLITARKALKSSLRQKTRHEISL